MIAYLDTSAAMKLLVEEAESAALTTYLQSEEGLDVVAVRAAHVAPVAQSRGAERHLARS